MEVVVLSFGIKAMGQKHKETVLKQLQRAVSATREIFPGAAIYISLLN